MADPTPALGLVRRSFECRELVWLAALTGALAACGGDPRHDDADGGHDNGDADADADADADSDADAAVAGDAGADAAPEYPEGLEIIDRAGGDCWAVQDIVFYGEKDIETTLALDEAGAPHVVTCGKTFPSDFISRSTLRHFTNESGDWTMEELRAQDFDRQVIPALSLPRVAMSPDDALHVLIGQFHEVRRGEEPDSGAALWHGIEGGEGLWSFEEVPTPAYSADSKLLIDDAGVLHVLTRERRINAETEALQLAHLVPGGEWSGEQVIDYAELRQNPAFAIDEQGNAHVTFIERCPEDWVSCQEVPREPRQGILRYGTNATGTWLFELISDVLLDTVPAIAVDAAGTVHLAYARLHDVAHSSNRTGAWQTEGLLARDARYQWVNMTLDGDGAVHLAVAGPVAANSQLMMYATNRGGDWLIEEIDATAPRNGGPVIAVGADAIPRVAFTNAGERESFHEVYASIATRCAAP